MPGGVPNTITLPKRRKSFGMDLETFQAYRVLGVVMAAMGAFFSAAIVISLLWVRLDLRTLPIAVGAAGFLIGGILLWRQHYSVGPKVLRRSIGALSIAFGPGPVSYSLQNLAEVQTADSTVFRIVVVSNMVLGTFLLLIGGVSLGSRRYATWYAARYERKREKWERRQAEKHKQRQ